MNCETILALEKELSFSEFKHEDGWTIATMILDKVKQEKLKSVAIRIVYHDLLIFQYVMDGKKEDSWLKRKQQTVEYSKHSSYYVYLKHVTAGCYQDIVDDGDYVICGGGFPLIVQQEIVGSICVSGLAHDEDHQLIVTVLKKYLKGKQ